MDDPSSLTVEALPALLKDDICVKVAGLDIDGIPRGKLMATNKFLSIAKTGFGFCSVIFGWDMHDQTYFRELKISNSQNGYRDILAEVDLTSFRRIPWENNVPFFLVKFREPGGGPCAPTRGACCRARWIKLRSWAMERWRERSMSSTRSGQARTMPQILQRPPLSYATTHTRHYQRLRKGCLATPDKTGA